MGLDLLAKFSVTKKVDESDGRNHFDIFLADDESVLLNFKHTRDRVVFTDRKIVAIDVQGMTGKKKEFRIFPYANITSFSVETAGTFDMDSDFKIWISGVGVFEIKFSKGIDIKEVGKVLSSKLK